MWWRPPGLVLGHTGPWPLFPPIRLPQAARAGHLYVIGKTGKGKSKFLQSCLLQDVAAGRGCGVIDPHADLINELLALLQQRGLLDVPEQWNRIIYINPAEHRYVIPFNVLQTPGDPYEVAQNVIEAFRRTWPESLWEAPHFSNIMLHALLVLIKTRRTLIDLPRLLVDQRYRERLLARTASPDLTAFFHDRFDRWGKQQGAIMKESSLNKVTALTMNPHLRLMLGQQENRLDFRAVMDGQKILLADLGQCDEESQRLIGNLITTGIEQAAFARHDTAPLARMPFFLYLDEFQDFSASSGSAKTLARILSGARKFGLHLTLAHQYLDQLNPQMKAAIVGNVWTKVIFGVSEVDAQEIAQWIGLGDIEPTVIKHAAQTPSQHPVYATISEQSHGWATYLANQKPRRAVVRNEQGQTRLLWTRQVKTHPVSPDALSEVKLRLLERYGRPLGIVNREVQTLRSDETSPDDWPEYDPL